MGHDSLIRLIAHGIESPWFTDFAVPIIVVGCGIIVRGLSMRSDDEWKPTELYAGGWDLMIAASILACETLFRLGACTHMPNTRAECTRYRRVMSSARVTADEYLLVTEAVQIGSIFVAIIVTALVRTFGWRRVSSNEWRLNGVGLSLPLLVGLLLLYCVHNLRNT